MYSTVAPSEQQQSDETPSGVSQANWMKLQELKERRQRMSKKTPDKRRRRNKKEPRHPTTETFHKKKNMNNERKWNELKEYFPKTSNEYTTVGCDNSSEKKITEAIEKGDLKTAETLSDQLVDNDFLTKAAVAIKSRDFDEKRKAEEEQNNQKRKKKKLHWGFEQKERWESKGNM